AQLALAQTVPVDGAAIVTTPSELSLADAARGFEMFDTLNVDVMGVVSNMSRHVCPDCGHESHIFGDPTLDEELESLDTELLGDIPLDPEVREQGDAGDPIVNAKPDSPTTEAFVKLGATIANKKPVDGDGEEGGEGDEDDGLFSFLKE
ncbi:MAG: P-loop NTPase, partial [Bradymonadaceae bacterium]